MALLAVAIHPNEIADWQRTGEGEYTVRRRAAVTPVYVSITPVTDDEP